ncbi:hypothetical protein F4861DRAFT_329038 [Xylaria intraflava]|nr:hypothetical protein F4861DRAFT_329038 [Xylaria intraflava]
MDLLPRLITAGNSTNNVTKIETDLVPLSGGGINLIVEAVFLTALTGLWTAMRLYCRHIKRVPLAIEDYIHLAALFFYYGQVITSFVSVLAGGAGHHVDELQSWHIVRFSKAIFVIQVLYALAVGLVKISITVMLMRIFVTRPVRIAGFAILVVSVLWVILTILVGLLLCMPIEKNWNPSVKGTCGNQDAGFGAVAGLDIFNELSLIILPIPSIFRLQLSRRYKLALAGIFGTGIVTLVVAALRIPILLETDFTDLTYDTRSQMAALAEPAVAIIISSSPMLRPLFDKVFSGILTTVDKSTTGQSRDTGYRRSIRGAEGHGYAKFTDSDGLLELGNVEVPGTNQRSETSITHVTGAPNRQAQPSGNGIVIKRETVITRDPRE